MNIAIIVRDLPYLKLLMPIMAELVNHKTPFILLYSTASKGTKEYNVPTLARLKTAGVNKYTQNLHPFQDDQQLKKQLLSHGIKKVISVEIGLWAKTYMDFFTKNSIKTYSVSYLTDSMWQPDSTTRPLHRIYHTADYIMRTHTTPTHPKDQMLGSPLFDGLMNKPSEGEDVLVLLPNLQADQVNKAFGSTKNFISIIEHLHAQNPRLIFKTRKKQFMPPEIKSYAKKIVADDREYPTMFSTLLPTTKTTVMFYSSGIYEAIYGGQYVINIKWPLGVWGWDTRMMTKYFGAVYDMEGAAESINQSDVLAGKPLNFQHIDPLARQQWVDRFIGSCPLNSARAIVVDILDS